MRLKRKYLSYADDHAPNGTIKPKVKNVPQFGTGADSTGVRGGTKGAPWPKGLSGRSLSKAGPRRRARRRGSWRSM